MLWLGLAGTLLAALPAIAPWLDPHLDLLRLDDAKNHLVRLHHLNWLLERGVWYPRWVPDMFMGYGYPLFNFYAPGFYYLASALGRLFRTDTWDTIRLTGLVAALAGTGGVYVLSYALGRRVLPAAFGALLLAYGPYTFQVNLWRRGALPEALGLALVPWLLLALHRLWHAPTHRRVAWTAAVATTASFLLLSHILTALAGFGVAGSWIIALAVDAGFRRGWWRSIVRALVPLALALGLTSFFWLPAVAEGRLVHLEELWLNAGPGWRGWFVEPNGGTDKDQKPDNRQTAHGWIDRNLHYPHQLIAAPKISLAQAGVGAATAIVLLVSMRSRRRRSLVLTAGLFVIALCCWLLTFSVSRAIWDLSPVLPFFQFPWRFLGPGGIALAAAGAGALSFVWWGAERRWGARRGGAAGALLVGLATVGVFFNSVGGLDDRSLTDRPRPSIDGRFLVDDERRDYMGAGTTSTREFLPLEVQVAVYGASVARHVSAFEHLYPDIDWLGGILRRMTPDELRGASGVAVAATHTGSDLRFVGWRTAPARLSVRVANDSPMPGAIGVRQLRFAGWRAWLDGAFVEIGVPGPVPEQQLSPGFMVISVPPGEHTIDLAFGPTATRLAAIGLTYASALAAGVGLVWRSHSRRRVLLPVILVASLLVTHACWRAVRPMFAHPVPLSVPVPPPSAGVWAAPDLAAQRYGGGLVVNIAEAVRSGQARVSSPTGATLGLSSFVDIRQITVSDRDSLRGAPGTSRREWLYMHPPASVSIEVALPPRRQVWFQAALTLDPAVWETDVGDGVRFQVAVTPLSSPGNRGPEAPSPESEILVVDQPLNPRARTEQRRWVPVAADLSRWGGTTVRLTLSTGPRDDASFDWAGWGDPVIAVLDTARDPLSRFVP